MKALGLVAVDLLQPDEWIVAQDAGLVASMGYPSQREDFNERGFNDRTNHALLLKELEATIPLAARAGVPNVITMFGNRRGKSDGEGIASCIAGLSRIKPLAEEQGVTVCVELLNSKVDHEDRETIPPSGWRSRKGSARRGSSCSGCPGRNENDEGQELNYHAIARAIADLGFPGYVAHEFVPKPDPLALAEAVRICGV